MVESRFESIRILLKANKATSLVGKAHIIGRLLTCPFLPVLKHIPGGARLLDIGAGHALFAHLARAAGAQQVVAIEPDLRKVFHTKQPAQIRYVAAFDDVITGQFDAISMIDVLYKIPVSGWDDLFVRIFKRLVPGGVFLLKEIDPRHRVKGGWNRFQEYLASSFGVTLGESFSYEDPDRMVGRLTRAGFTAIRTTDLGRWYPHAHILYIAHRPKA